MLLPHTIFPGAVTTKYSFSFNHFLIWNCFQFRKLKYFAHRIRWPRPQQVLKAAGGHLSGWFLCRCNCQESPKLKFRRWGEPSLHGQAVGGWVLVATLCLLFRSGAALPIQWKASLCVRTCWAQPVNCGHLFLHFTSHLGFVSWNEIRCS